MTKTSSHTPGNIYEVRNTPGTAKAKRASEKSALTRRVRTQPITLAGSIGAPSSAPPQDERPQHRDRP